MNPTDFMRWPLLVTRRHLIQAGLTDKQLAQIRVIIRNPQTSVPSGCLGWVPDRPGSRKGKYRKIDLALLLGIKL